LKFFFLKNHIINLSRTLVARFFSQKKIFNKKRSIVNHSRTTYQIRIDWRLITDHRSSRFYEFSRRDRYGSPITDWSNPGSIDHQPPIVDHRISTSFLVGIATDCRSPIDRTPVRSIINHRSSIIAFLRVFS
jgi:hypothetical protein